MAYQNQNKKLIFQHLRSVLGEGLVTFLFMFVICATHVNHMRSGATDSSTFGAVSTGFAATALIYSFGDVSGAHFNPAVTFATVVTGKTPLLKGALYILIQLFSSTMSTIFIRVLYSTPSGSSVKTAVQHLFVDIDPNSNVGLALLMEFILTYILVYVIFATALDTVEPENPIKVDNVIIQLDENGQPIPAQHGEGVNRNLTIHTSPGTTKNNFAPMAIGFTLGFLGLIGGTVSGGAFNPARVFGPALVGGFWKNHWLYWVGDLLGGTAAGFTQMFFSQRRAQIKASDSAINIANAV